MTDMNCNLEPLPETPSENPRILAELTNAQMIAEKIIEKEGLYRDYVQVVRIGTGLDKCLCLMYDGQIIGTFSSNIAQREDRYFIDTVFSPKMDAISICGKINAAIERNIEFKKRQDFVYPSIKASDIPNFEHKK